MKEKDTLEFLKEIGVPEDRLDLITQYVEQDTRLRSEAAISVSNVDWDNNSQCTAMAVRVLSNMKNFDKVKLVNLPASTQYGSLVSINSIRLDMKFDQYYLSDLEARDVNPINELTHHLVNEMLVQIDRDDVEKIYIYQLFSNYNISRIGTISRISKINESDKITFISRYKLLEIKKDEGLELLKKQGL